MTVSFRAPASAIRRKRDRHERESRTRESWAQPFPRTWMLRPSSNSVSEAASRRQRVYRAAQASAVKPGGLSVAVEHAVRRHELEAGLPAKCAIAVGLHCARERARIGGREVVVELRAVRVRREALDNRHFGALRHAFQAV